MVGQLIETSLNDENGEEPCLFCNRLNERDEISAFCCEQCEDLYWMLHRMSEFYTKKLGRAMKTEFSESIHAIVKQACLNSMQGYKNVTEYCAKKQHGD